MLAATVWICVALVGATAVSMVLEWVVRVMTRIDIRRSYREVNVIDLSQGEK